MTNMEGGITEANIGRATRTTAIMALFAAVLMLGVPSIPQSSWTDDIAPVGQAAAAGAGNRQITLGWSDFTTTIATLNPLDYTMATEYMVFAPCYSTILTYDTDGKTIIGDLARSWSLSPNGLFWNITLSPNAKFYDKNLAPAAFHSVTAADVIFSFNINKDEPQAYYHSYFPVINGQNVLKSIVQGANPYEIKIELSTLYAPFSSVLTALVILPQYIWTGENWDWDNFGGGKAAIVGSGPFFYNLSGLPQTGLVELNKNPYWHWSTEYGYEVRTDKLYIRSETSDDANLNDFKDGLNDIMMYALAAQYLNVFNKPEWADIFKFDVSTGFVYEYNLNQMTDARRDTMPPKFRSGGAYNNQLLLNYDVKLALAKSINKQEFINQIRGGMGDVATSLVPKANPWHYRYGSDPARDQLDLSFDTAAARQILRNAGWVYNLAGQYVPPTDTTTYPLCKAGGSDPLRFRFYTLDTSPEWEAAARLIATWAQQAGVDLWTEMKIKNSNDLNGDWTTANYDIWIWDWIFSPTSDISVDVMTVLTTWDAWTDVFWSDPTFDALWNKSVVTMDPELRRLYGDEMQRLAYENMGCQLIAYRADLFAASSRGLDKWTNYGNWKDSWAMIPDMGYPWLWVQIQPKEQQAPKISGLSVPAIGYVGTQVDVSASVTDSNTMWGKWIFDREGNASTYEDVSGGVATGHHTYTRDGEYEIFFAVKENNSADGFVNVSKAKIKIYDLTNDAPTGVDFTWSPPSGINAGTIVTFTALGSDPEGDPLYYSWNFGDGGGDQGKIVSHQFRDGAPSSVTLSVTDNRYGTGTRPQTMLHAISVGPNEKPSLSVNDPGQVPPNTLYPLTVTASDPESDPLTYTWEWGDGTAPTITTTPTADHRYRNQGLYNLTVHADDGTTLFGHNVTDWRIISVRRGVNAAPTMDSWGIAPTRNPVRYQDLTFYANATDDNNDALEFTFTFESGVTQKIVVDTNSKTENAVLVHEYANTGLKIASVSVTDYVAVATSTTLTVTVALGDHEPVIAPLSNIKETVGFSHSFTASATDSDGDGLTYWWDFGDFMGSAAGQSVSYPYVYGSGLGGFLYRVWVNDNNVSNPAGPMNVSAYAYAYVNAVPWINLNGTTQGPFVGGVANPLHLNASDNDTLDISALKITWNFGDGTVVSGVGGDMRDVSHAFPNPAFNTTFKVQAWVQDAWVDDFGRSHNVTKSWNVVVNNNPALPIGECTLNIVAGWNFITVPITGGPYKASNLGLQRLDVVVSWNPATKVYDRTYIVGVSPPSLDITLLPSSGYWVSTTVNQTIHVYGVAPSGTQTRTITATGSTWVNIGLVTLNTTWKASRVPTLISGATVSTVAMYNPVTKSYKTYITGVPPSDYTLVPGTAVWALVSGSCTLTYSP